MIWCVCGASTRLRRDINKICINLQHFSFYELFYSIVLSFVRDVTDERTTEVHD